MGPDNLRPVSVTQLEAAWFTGPRFCDRLGDADRGGIAAGPACHATGRLSDKTTDSQRN